MRVTNEICCICNEKVDKKKYRRSTNKLHYCSRQCYSNRRKENLKRLKRGSKYYDDLLNETTCICGENKKYLLQIHHIDGNHNNNKPENLEIVCANCHIKRHLKLNKKGEYVYHPRSLTNRELLKSL